MIKVEAEYYIIMYKDNIYEYYREYNQIDENDSK